METTVGNNIANSCRIKSHNNNNNDRGSSDDTGDASNDNFDDIDDH